MRWKWILLPLVTQKATWWQVRQNIVSNCGAYVSLRVAQYFNVLVHILVVPINLITLPLMVFAFTQNTVPGGAFRGFGVTQTIFGQEQNIDELAALVGMDPWEFRYKTLFALVIPYQTAKFAPEETALAECLEAVKMRIMHLIVTGLAVCLKNSGIGVGLPDTGRVILEVRDGKVRIRNWCSMYRSRYGDYGYQVLCETTGLTADKVFVERPDTVRTPDSGTTTASRQTVFTGEATRKASLRLKEMLETKTLEELNGVEIL